MLLSNGTLEVDSGPGSRWSVLYDKTQPPLLALIGSRIKVAVKTED